MADKLEPLDDVTRISDAVIRILGGNPGKFTLQGTNTYLIDGPQASSSSPAPCFLIDTGEGRDVYPPLLQSILDGKHDIAGPSKRTITDIILTHRHHDHVGGLPSVLQMLAARRRSSTAEQRPPRIHKLPDAATDDALHEKLTGLPPDSYEATSSGAPIWPLADHDQLTVGGEASAHKSGLRVVHTPGHTTDHICLLLEREGSLLTGDHVLGQGTSVFEDLGAYLSSLRKCIHILEEPRPGQGSSEGHRRLYPAHGPTIFNGREALEGYLSHRLEREDQIVQLLGKPREDGSGASGSTPEWTIPALVSTLYSNYPETLYPAAARGLFLHLRKLAHPDPEALTRGAAGADEARGGRRVACAGQAAGPDGTAPAVPAHDAEWLRVMDLTWSLLGPVGSAGTPTGTAEVPIPDRGSGSPSKGAL